MNMKSWLIALLFIAAVASQATVLPDPFQDPELAKLLNNYFGCKTY